MTMVYDGDGDGDYNGVEGGRKGKLVGEKYVLAVLRTYISV